jgi:hypothetical protein
MNFDPLTQDIYIVPIMSTAWHLWRAGSPESVCGLPWTVAQRAWNATAEKPASGICEQCSPVGEGAGL